MLRYLGCNTNGTVFSTTSGPDKCELPHNQYFKSGKVLQTNARKRSTIKVFKDSGEQRDPKTFLYEVTLCNSVSIQYVALTFIRVLRFCAWEDARYHVFAECLTGTTVHSIHAERITIVSQTPLEDSSHKILDSSTRSMSDNDHIMEHHPEF